MTGCEWRRLVIRTTRRTVFVREVEAKFVLIFLNGHQGREFDVAVACEAPGIEAPGVVAGLVHDQLRQQPPVTAALAQTRAHADCAVGIALAGICPTSSAPSMV